MKDNIAKMAAVTSMLLVGFLTLATINAYFDQRAQAQPVQGGILNPSRLIDSTLNNTNTGWTNRILGSGQAAVMTRIDARSFKETSVEFSFEAASANSGLVTVFFGRNNSGLQGITNMEQFALLTATANGTAHITVCTNFGPENLGGGYANYYVMAISNGGVGYLTNYTLTLGQK